MQIKTVTTSGGTLVDYQAYIRFYGNGDRFSMSYLAGSDTVQVMGTNQTLVMVRSNSDTIHDNGHGLKLEFGQPSMNDTVYGFQNDKTGTVVFNTAVTLTPDHHGGILASTLGLSVDFMGFHNTAELAARIRLPSSWT